MWELELKQKKLDLEKQLDLQETLLKEKERELKTPHHG
jgi:hypothetical protein